MALYRTYCCPSCEKTFDFLHHPNDEPPPNYCPLCGADVSGRKKAQEVDRVRSPGLSERVKRLPRAGRTVSKSADSVYRGMENASNGRMEEAASLLGCDTRSLSAMKMTDMKDGLREGDLSGQSYTPAKATELTGSAPVFELPGAPKGMNAFQGGTEGSEYAKTVGTGPSPFAGNKIRELVTSTHGARSQSVARAGQINKA